jgi:hypothetical protein
MADEQPRQHPGIVESVARAMAAAEEAFLTALGTDFFRALEEIEQAAERRGREEGIRSALQRKPGASRLDQSGADSWRKEARRIVGGPMVKRGRI